MIYKSSKKLEDGVLHNKMQKMKEIANELVEHGYGCVVIAVSQTKEGNGMHVFPFSTIDEGIVGEILQIGHDALVKRREFILQQN